MRGVVLAAGGRLHLHLKKKDPTDVPADLTHWMFLRGLFGAGALTSYFMAIKYGQFSLVVALYYTAPVSSAVLCFLVLREKLSKFDIINICCCFLGVLFITNPGGIFEKVDDSKVEEGSTLSGLLWAMCASLSSGSAYLTMRKMGKRVYSGLPPMYMGLYTAIITSMISVFAQEYPVQGITFR